MPARRGEASGRRPGDGGCSRWLPIGSCSCSVGGAPTIGNTGYGLEVSAVGSNLFLLLAGFDRCAYAGAIPLPLDGTPLLPELNGCWILADAPVILNGVVAGTPAAVPLAIPNNPTYAGVGIFTQVLGLDLATFAGSMSSGFASSLGY